MREREPWAWTEGDMNIVQASYELSDELGFCGCGLPEKAGEFILDLLEAYSDKNHAGEPAMGNHAALDALLPNAGARYFALYQLHRCELTGHGTSLPGWLTAKGVALRKALREFGPDAVDEVVINYDTGENVAE